MSWKNNKFLRADDPATVGWVVMYWRTVKDGDNYRLESRQFDHLPSSATEEEATALLNKYVTQKKESGQQDSVKNLNLFLCQVHTHVQISNNTGEIL